MKLNKFFLLFATLAFAACGGSDEGGSGDGSAPGGQTITLKTSSGSLLANGRDKIVFTVEDEKGTDLTKYAKIFDDKNNSIGKTFTTTTPGTYTFWASVGSRISATVSVVAVEQEAPQIPADPNPSSTSFAHRTLITQFTGTACGYCPNMIDALEKLESDATYGDKFLLGACHSYNQNDPMWYSGNSVLTGAFGVRNWPYVVVGFTEGLANYGVDPNVTNLKKAIDKCLQSSAKAGIALNSKSSNNSLLVNVQVKAAETGNYFVGVWLVEDGIEYAQNGANQSTITHNSAIRYNISPYNGEALNQIQAGKTAEKLFDVDLDGEWVKKNCRILAFVCVPQGSKYAITNVISAPLDTAVAYEYK